MRGIQAVSASRVCYVQSVGAVAIGPALTEKAGRFVTVQTFSRYRTGLAVIVLLFGSLLGIAGTDLVLPAIPSLPAALGGTETSAQYVLAAFVAGFAVGLILFGELGSHVDGRRLFAGSLLLYGLTSAACAGATSIGMLIPLRFLEGACGAAPAVFAPGFIRLLFDETRAVRTLGLFGSTESLVPAMAPLAGAWLLAHFGWQSSFVVIAVLALAVATFVGLAPGLLPRAAKSTREASYLTLLGDPVYMRLALSQSLSLGGILVFVFGSPTVITATMGGSLTHFIVNQMIGVSFFILGANGSGLLLPRLGSDRLITLGTVISAAGTLAMLAYALMGGNTPEVLPVFWVVVNLGFGLRSPAGFYAALKAAHGNAARGSALIFLGFLSASALGTAAVAPFIAGGIVPLTLATALVSCGAAVCMWVLPKARVK